jgi:outer membrane protein TolC
MAGILHSHLPAKGLIGWKYRNSSFAESVLAIKVICKMHTLKPMLALFCAVLVAAPVFAQEIQLETGGDRPVIGRYQAHPIAPVNLANSGRLEALVRAGKIYLSLQDAIALALENNIDIEVQRYAMPLAQADLLRAKSGGLIRGISTSVSSSNQGSTTQSLTNTTTAGTPGGITSTTFAGPATESLDPIIQGQLNWGHYSTPQTNTLFTGVTSLVQTQKNYNFGLAQGFLTGTSASLSLTNSSTFQNTYTQSFNPSLQSALDLQINQHLLQGFGLAVNNRFIRIAKNNIKVADLVFRQQVMATTANVIGLYWGLVSYNEAVTVAKQALALAQKLYNDNRKQVEIGTLAPIEIVRAEAEVASREQDLTTAETGVLQQETILKNALSKTGIASPTLAEVRIVATDHIVIPQTEPVQPIQDLINQAIQNRPELGQSNLQIENSRISLKGSKNGLLPTLDGFVDLRNHGLAGQVNNIAIPPGSPFIRQAGAVDPFFIGGVGDAFGQIFGRNFPDYAVGLQLNIPLRNRAAQADYATAELTLRQNQLQYQRQVNGVRVDVQNALIASQQARARYVAADKNRVLAEQTLDAEQKKYALGASTVFLVIQAQRDLATAQGNLVAAESSYAQAKVQLEYSTGDVLDRYNVSIDDAVKGSVAHPPSAIPVVDEPKGPGSSGTK